MKKLLLCTTLLLTKAFCYAEPNGTTINLTLNFPGTLGQPGTPAVTINNNNDNKNSPHVESEIGIDAKQSTEQQSLQKNLQHTDQLNQHKQHQNAKNSAHQKQTTLEADSSSGSWFPWLGLPSLKTVLITSAVTGTALFATYKLITYKTNSLLVDKQAWCNWKHEQQLEELLQKPADLITKELLAAIQLKHANSANPTDHMQPSMTFLDSIKAEKDLLQNYMTIMRWMGRVRIGRLVTYKDASLLVQKRLDRLAYLNQLFFSWAHQHRVRQTSLTA